MNNGYYPYGVKPDSKNIRFDQGSQGEQMNKYKEEEKQQKADKVLPHELQNAAYVLSNVFTNLTEMRNMLDSAQKNTEINQHAVDNIKNKIDEVNKIVLDLEEDFDKISI